MNKVKVENVTAHNVTLRDGITGDECSVLAFEKTSVEPRFLERPHNLVLSKTDGEEPEVLNNEDEEVEDEEETPPALNSASRKPHGHDLSITPKPGSPNHK